MIKKSLFAAIFGAGLGFLYYYFIGCSGGTCPITSNPYISTLWGGLMGFIVVFNPCCNKNKCQVQKDV